MAITPLNEQDRAWVVEEAKRRAGPNATDAQQKRELYNYAQWQGKTPEELDQWMGYTPGTSAAWNAQNPLGGEPVQNSPATIGANMQVSGAGNQAAYNTPMPPAANLGIGGGGGAGAGVGAVSAGDNRWQGDPYRNPDGSLKTAIEGGGGYPGTIDPRGAGGRYGGGGNLGMGGNGDMGYQRNPYLDATSRDIGAQMFDQWNRNVAPGLRSGAMATGGYGGSRQGVVEANALNDLGRNYSQALTSMYGQDYTNYQNRGIQRQGQAQSYDLGRGGLANQRYGQDQSYDLGLRNNALGWQGQAQSYDLGLRNSDLGFASLDANINNSNFNNQMTAANFGLGVQDYLNKNNATGIAAGTQINNAPWDYQKYLNSAGNQAGSGYGTNTTTKTGG